MLTLEKMKEIYSFIEVEADTSIGAWCCDDGIQQFVAGDTFIMCVLVASVINRISEISGMTHQQVLEIVASALEEAAAKNKHSVPMEGSGAGPS